MSTSIEYIFEKMIRKRIWNRNVIIDNRMNANDKDGIHQTESVINVN